MYNFGCRPSDSAAILVAVGRAAHIVGPNCCFLVVLGLVLAGSAGVLLIGNFAMHPTVAAALLCPGLFGWNRQGGLFLHVSEEGTHLT